MTRAYLGIMIFDMCGCWEPSRTSLARGLGSHCAGLDDVPLRAFWNRTLCGLWGHLGIRVEWPLRANSRGVCCASYQEKHLVSVSHIVALVGHFAFGEK